jgi:hypothetical protein
MGISFAPTSLAVTVVWIARPTTYRKAWIGATKQRDLGEAVEIPAGMLIV